MIASIELCTLPFRLCTPLGCARRRGLDMTTMRVVTQEGYNFLRRAELLLNEGLIDVPCWEHAVIEIYTGNQVDGQGHLCDYEWSRGCHRAKWSYTDPYSTTDDYMHGYLCESCAAGDVDLVRNLTPLNNGVYDPDIDIVIRNNYSLYVRTAHANGLRVF